MAKNRIIKIGISGYKGKMGRKILECLNDNTKLKVTDRIEVITKGGEIGENKEYLFKNSDVVIDFTNAKGLSECLKLAKKTKTPLVSGSTPVNNDLMKQILDASKYTKICWSANMSIGIAVVCKLLSICGKLLSNYDCDILERHHNKKKDAPSGTALMLGKCVANSRGFKNINDIFICDRNSERKKDQIGFASIRGGNIVGDHEVMFIGENDEIKITHRAYDRGLFALGAIKCAFELIKQKENKFYKVEDLINF